MTATKYINRNSKGQFGKVNNANPYGSRGRAGTGITNELVLMLQEKVKEKTARLVYNDPYYWVVLENPIKINKGHTITVMPSSHLEEENSKLKNEVDIQKRLYTNLVQENNTMAIKIQMLDSVHLFTFTTK